MRKITRKRRRETQFEVCKYDFERRDKSGFSTDLIDLAATCDRVCQVEGLDLVDLASTGNKVLRINGLHLSDQATKWRPLTILPTSSFIPSQLSLHNSFADKSHQAV